MSGGLQWATSNGQNINDLGGVFGNGSVGGGDGLGGSGDAFMGPSPDGWVTGTGFTLGGGAGIGGFAGFTNTNVSSIAGRKDRIIARLATGYYAITLPTVMGTVALALLFFLRRM